MTESMSMFEILELYMKIMYAAMGCPALEAATMKEMCEMIADHWRVTRGVTKKPRDIYRYSANGEPYMVAVWYQEARLWQSTFRALPSPR